MGAFRAVQRATSMQHLRPRMDFVSRLGSFPPDPQPAASCGGTVMEEDHVVTRRAHVLVAVAVASNERKG